jgi:hypothetical protein
MKIRFFKLALAAVLLGGMISCVQEEPTRVPAKMDLENVDELGKAALTFSNRAETKTVNFTADGDWYIRIPKDCDWLTVSPKEGSAGDVAVNISTKLYEAETARTATLAFVVDGLEQKATLDVTQLQKFFLEVTVDNPVLGKTGGEFTFPVATNGTYDVNIKIGEGSEANWLTLVESDAKAITFNAAAIQGKRNDAVVTLTCKEDPTTVHEFALSQKNLQLSFDYAEAYAKGEVTTVEIPVTVINIENWTVASSADWCTATAAEGKVVLTMNKNSNDVVRSTTLNISTPEDEEMKGSIVFTQYPSDVITPDLCNIVYDQNGVPTDISPKNSPVKYYPGNQTESINYYEQYKRYAPSFNATPGANLSASAMYGYYVDYTDWQTAFNDGYTIEAVFSIPKAHNNAESKAFGGTGSGGFAIMLGNTGRGGSIEFIQHNGSAWCFGSTGIIPEPERFYHVIGVYDPSAKKIHTYVDGELIVSVACTGIKHMKTAAKKLCVGANYTDAAGNGSWSGAVVVSRAYDAVMTADQVKAATVAVNIPAELYTKNVVLK